LAAAFHKTLPSMDYCAADVYLVICLSAFSNSEQV